MRIASCIGVLLMVAAAAPTRAGTTYETRVVTGPGSFSGTVVEYVPRKTIVIRDPEQRVYTYSLSPEMIVPADVAVGRTVTLRVEPTPQGVTLVRQVTVTSVAADGRRETTTRTTETMADGRSATMTGTIVEWVPQKTLVLRDADDRQVTYTLGPELVMPEDAQVGKTVKVYASSTSPDGSATVTRVTSTRVTPEGDVQTTRTTEKTSAGVPAVVSEMTVEGVVSKYKENKRVTLLRSDGSKVTYMLDSSTAAPSDLEDGQHVVLHLSRSGNPRTVETITYASSHH